MKRAAAWVDLAVVPDPRAWLEARLGEFDEFECAMPRAVQPSEDVTPTCAVTANPVTIDQEPTMEHAFPHWPWVQVTRPAETSRFTCEEVDASSPPSACRHGWRPKPRFYVVTAPDHAADWRGSAEQGWQQFLSPIGADLIAA